VFHCEQRRKGVDMHHLFPAWNGIHELIVHVPIILLLVAPFFVIVSMGLPAAKRRPFLGSALTLMVLGTAMTFLAVATGEAAMKVVASAPAFKAALEEHRALAETTTGLFFALTIGFTALVFAPRLLGRELESRINTVLLAVYLLFYATGALFLIHTALQGGHLAHGLDVKSVATYQLPGKEGAR
jgi:uncharacterized membrane protein